MFYYSWMEVPKMMLLDQIKIKQLLEDYQASAVVRRLLDVLGEDAALQAFADALREKGQQEQCAGCKAAADHIEMLATDDASRSYVAQEGANCPECDSLNIEGGSFDVEGGLTEQRTVCYDCNASWVARSLLIGFRDLELGGDNEND